MNGGETLALLRSVGAITEGHFILSSGLHSGVYVEKFRALEVPSIAMELGKTMGRPFESDGVDVVLAPAVGGVILGFAVAVALGARCVFTERVEGLMQLRRNFEIRPSERVLAVEDVMTTGKSLREILPFALPGALIGITVLVDRSGKSQDWPVRFVAAAQLAADSFDASKCPMCARGEPFEKPGSRDLGKAAV